MEGKAEVVAGIRRHPVGRCFAAAEDSRNVSLVVPEIVAVLNASTERSARLKH